MADDVKIHLNPEHIVSFYAHEGGTRFVTDAHYDNGAHTVTVVETVDVVIQRLDGH